MQRCKLAKLNKMYTRQQWHIQDFFFGDATNFGASKFDQYFYFLKFVFSIKKHDLLLKCISYITKKTKIKKI